MHVMHFYALHVYASHAYLFHQQREEATADPLTDGEKHAIPVLH